jgi:hypothetical protein
MPALREEITPELRRGEDGGCGNIAASRAGALAVSELSRVKQRILKFLIAFALHHVEFELGMLIELCDSHAYLATT